ncbi:D-alanyl-D-alanine carboxypeptidase, partial [Alkalihalophilus pseudofirmus]|nr:D-alanyl-D-alanine carboxypeptidase [Alkalihalophilus pseudofirmus]
FKTFQHSTINQGEIFKKDSQEFHPNSDILVTEDVHGITKDVSNSGILSIKNNRGEVLQTVQLKSMERKPQAAAAVKKDKPKEKAAPKHEMNAIYGVMLIIFAAAVFGTARKITRKY